MKFSKTNTHCSIRRICTLGLLTSIIALSACQTAENKEMQSSLNSSIQNEKLNKAMARAADSAMQSGQTGQALSILEKSYQRDNQNAETATRYAQALRQSGQIEKAEMVLKSFANAPDASIKTQQEYVFVQLEAGHYDIAEEIGKKIVAKDSLSAQAHHSLGIALDAQGKHAEAEKSLRAALDMWEGDPVPVMNNLALNLASQENVKEAVLILKKAKSIAPNRIEIERNLRIISTLNESPKAFKSN